MKRLACLALVLLVLPSCQTVRDYYDLWFVVPPPPPMEGSREWRSR